jgi:hypothetical protein
MMTPLQKGRFWLNPTNKFDIFQGSKSVLFVYEYTSMKGRQKTLQFSACHMSKMEATKFT